ncbi:MAG: hypothetical protein A3J63_04215 [Candidatus Moranbacteria bacterium RIFCSPHIGHO2_02_FULL_40_12b]|nr:MAG: hypothetical protein A3J63_04215 [Candidatus Moranbacteria bacterium RIFCSPHIGHO2_02_FULL_40_12b]OGI23156.1 MAG: hypothetical protein A3E91_03055 [Candidatus Moranbacteria bacterium RIFCSPHIGHO2_12_FULL_40_10]
MGIQVEFNSDLALRNISEFKAGRRKIEECVPSPLRKEKVYNFLKKGLRNYWLDGELPLVETKGDQKLSRPLASIVILEATHFKQKGEMWTKGKYKIIEVFKDDKIHFENMTILRK